MVFPIPTKEESDVKSDILKMLEKGEKVPSYNNLILDSFNYYSSGRFNDAIILMNIGLEEFMKEFFFHKLTEEKKLTPNEADRTISEIFSDKKKQRKTGLHRVMSVDLKEINGRSLEEYPELWSKFDSARKIRKNVMHPHTTKISQETSLDTIESLLKIICWVNKNK